MNPADDVSRAQDFAGSVELALRRRIPLDAFDALTVEAHVDRLVNEIVLLVGLDMSGRDCREFTTNTVYVPASAWDHLKLALRPHLPPALRRRVRVSMEPIPQSVTRILMSPGNER